MALMPIPEIARRLKEICRPGGRGKRDGSRLSLKAVERFTGLSHLAVAGAVHERNHSAKGGWQPATERKGPQGRKSDNGVSGSVTRRTQVQLTQFFRLYDSGRVLFHFSQGTGWTWSFPENPVPPKVITLSSIVMTEQGPRIRFSRWNSGDGT